MRDKFLVIAWSQNEFHHGRWHDEKTCIYVSGPDKIRGCRNVDFIITEAAWSRWDINKIIENLIICNMCGPYNSKTQALRMERLLYA